MLAYVSILGVNNQMIRHDELIARYIERQIDAEKSNPWAAISPDAMNHLILSKKNALTGFSTLLAGALIGALTTITSVYFWYTKIQRYVDRQILDQAQQPQYSSDTA